MDLTLQATRQQVGKTPFKTPVNCGEWQVERAVWGLELQCKWVKNDKGPELLVRQDVSEGLGFPSQ